MRWLLLLLPVALLLAACPSSPSEEGDDDVADDDDATDAAPCDAEHPDHTVGLQLCTPEAWAGYTLVAPQRSLTTFLIDMHGEVVHRWDSEYEPGNSAYLLETGQLLRTGRLGPGGNDVFSGGGAGGVVQLLAWDGAVEWEFEYSTAQAMQHHDVEPMPDGTVLIVAWEHKTEAEAIDAGRDPELLSDGELWPDHLIQVDPADDSIVWAWHLWDHLVQDHDFGADNYGVVADHPELVDLNAVGSGPNGGKADWNHVNSVAYNPALDQVILSSHNQNEIWIIDHSTTTEEAAGHTGGASGRGGDLLYRWGNPATYDAPGAQALEGQHDARWIDAGLPGEGDLLVFDNGRQRGWSAVVQLTPPMSDGAYTLDGDAFGPVEPTWDYSDADFYSKNISGAQRLPNGNTLICEGAFGRVFEVTEAGEIVWQYINPVTADGVLDQGDELPGAGGPGGGTGNGLFRATRIGADHPGLVGRDLVADGTIEG